MSSADAAEPERVPTLRHRFEYVALRAFAGLVRLVGLRVSYLLAKGLGSAIWIVDARHRRVAISNLRERLLDPAGRPLPEREIRRLARDSFRHLALCAVEIIHLPREQARRGLLDIIDAAGRDHLETAFAAGRGVIVATAHVGNWEVMGALCNELGLHFTTVYRPLDNPLLDGWIRSTRAAAGQTMVPKAGALRTLLRALKSGGMVVLLVDQDARRHGIFVPFFGAPASTIPTPADLALRTGAVIVSAVSRRVGPGFRYVVSFSEPIDVSKTADHAADVVRITAKINADIEAGIRLAPEQWLWTHRRWKTKP